MASLYIFAPFVANLAMVITLEVLGFGIVASLLYKRFEHKIKMACPPKRSPVIMLDWNLESGNKWSKRDIHQSRLSVG